jgi:hypothetical protein
MERKTDSFTNCFDAKIETDLHSLYGGIFFGTLEYTMPIASAFNIFVVTSDIHDIIKLKKL